MELVEPLSLLVPRRGAAFLDVYLASKGRKDWDGLLQALIKAEERDCLACLADHLPRLSEQELRKLAWFVEKQPGVPESFRTALAKATGGLPPDQGVKGMLRRIRRHLPGQ
jgi:hypothetical protein